MISLVIGLLLIIWVKITLNSFANEMKKQLLPDVDDTDQTEKRLPADDKLTKPQSQEVAKEAERIEKKPEFAYAAPEAARTEYPNFAVNNPMQPPPTQSRPPIPWGAGMAAPMPMGATLIQVEPDPDDSAFDNAE